MTPTATCGALFGNDGFVLPKMSGNSMRPLIWSGEHCVAVVPLEGEPGIGDILMFRHTSPDNKDRNVVHRLVEIREERGERHYIMRGDNCLGSEAVSRGDIIGRVAEVHRLSGFRPWHAIGARQFSMTDPAYLRYSRLWMAIWPARRVCYLIRARLGGLFTRLRNIKREK